MESDVKMRRQPVAVFRVGAEGLSRMPCIQRPAGWFSITLSMTPKSQRFLVCVVLPRMAPVANFQSGEQIDRAVALIDALHP